MYLVKYSNLSRIHVSYIWVYVSYCLDVHVVTINNACMVIDMTK